MRLHLWLLVAAALAPLASSNHLDFNGTHFVEVDDKGEFVSIAEQTASGADQTAISSHEVARLSEELRLSVDEFKV